MAGKGTVKSERESSPRRVASGDSLIHAVIQERLDALQERMETRFKSIEVNMAAGFSAVVTRQDVANGAVSSLRESEIRRDEREKVQGQMFDRVQATTRWYLVTAIAVTGVVVSAAARFL